MGSLCYGKREGGHWLVTDVDPGLSAYYRSQIPKMYGAQQPRYPAHITTVRNEAPPNINLWGKYDGESVAFEYYPIVEDNDFYFWLRVGSHRLVEIRVELGLPVHTTLTMPPDGSGNFHITIANRKNTLRNANDNCA